MLLLVYFNIWIMIVGVFVKKKTTENMLRIML